MLRYDEAQEVARQRSSDKPSAPRPRVERRTGGDGRERKSEHQQDEAKHGEPPAEPLGLLL